MYKWLTVGLLMAVYSTTPSLLKVSAMAETMEQQPAKPLDEKGSYCGVRTPRQLVVRNEATWEKLWKEHLGGRELPMPAIDFKKLDVVAIYAGSKNTGGYALEINEIKRGKSDAEVVATLTKPGKGSIVTQAFTSPYALRAVPKLPGKVKFTVTEKERG